jgi:hypothetical protein
VRVRLEVSMAGTFQIIIFWIVTACSLLGGYQHFGTLFTEIEEASSSEMLVNTIRRHNEEHYKMNPKSIKYEYR